MRYARHTLAIAALLAIVAFSWPSAAHWQQARLADRMALEILAGDASKCGPAIDQLSSLGQPAVEPLMFLAACGTPQIAADAQEAVLDLATTWEIDFETHGDADAFADRLAVLAAALSQHAGRFDAAAWPWQQRLARRIVADCEHVPAGDALAILRCCDRALATARPAAPAPPPIIAVEKPLAPPPLPEQLQSPPLIAAEPTTEPMAEVAADTPPVSSIAPLPPPAAESLNALRSSSDATIAPPPTTPWDDVSVAEAPESPAALPISQAPRPVISSPPDVAASIVEVPSPAESEALLRSLRRQSDRELLAGLPAASRYQAAVIQQALRIRGYSQALLDSILRWQNETVEERRHALERIDSLPSADARRVLRWFVDDPEPTLRLQALAMLATTGDPRLTEIARQRAAQDADPRVAALANRLMSNAK